MISVPFSTLVVMCFCKLSSASTNISVLSDCSITTSMLLLTSILLKLPSTVLFSVVTFPLPSIEFKLIAWLHDAKSSAAKATRMYFVINVMTFNMANLFL